METPALKDELVEDYFQKRRKGRKTCQKKSLLLLRTRRYGKKMSFNRGEIIIYKPLKEVELKCDWRKKRFGWMLIDCSAFGVNAAIVKHINNIYKTSELGGHLFHFGQVAEMGIRK